MTSAALAAILVLAMGGTSCQRERSSTAAALPTVRPTPSQAAAVSLVILHWNDLHGALAPTADGQGGTAHLAGLVASVRSAAGAGNVLLLDAGDAFLAAQPVSQLMLGESTIDLYNRLGVAAAALGNHEFDKGQDVLASRVAQSAFPWLASNVVLAGSDWEHPPWVRPYAVLSVGSTERPVRLGIIGLAAPDTPAITVREGTAGLEFLDPAEAVVRYYAQVEAESDAVILLAHLYTQRAGGLTDVVRRLQAQGIELPLVVAGHGHEVLPAGMQVGSTTIVSAGSHGQYLGRVDLRADPEARVLVVERARLLPVTSATPADPAIAERLAYWSAAVAPLERQPVGVAAVCLVRDYYRESNLGNLVADAMLWQTDAFDDGEVNGSVQVAFTNPGGLRADIPLATGAVTTTVTWGDTFRVIPFGNTLVVMSLTGQQLQQVLDQSARLSKGLLQASGVRYSWHNDRGAASATVWGAYDVVVAGQPIDPTATYRVVTNSFLAEGQDLWTTFAQGDDVWDTYLDQQEAVNAYIAYYNATVGPLDHAVEGRFPRLHRKP